jgi:hypothetical protein
MIIQPGSLDADGNAIFWFKFDGTGTCLITERQIRQPISGRWMEQSFRILLKWWVGEKM